MATTPGSCLNLSDFNHNRSLNLQLTQRNCGDQSQFLQRKTNLQFPQRSTYGKSSSNRVSIVRKVMPEAAADVVSSSAIGGADLLSSLSLPSIPGFSDNPWITAIAGLLVGVPFVIQQLLTLTRVDMAAETVEKITDVVVKAAEDLAESLPDGGLKNVVTFVENLAEETAKDAQMVEDLMDKVEDFDDKLEDFWKNKPKRALKKRESGIIRYPNRGLQRDYWIFHRIKNCLDPFANQTTVSLPYLFVALFLSIRSCTRSSYL